MMGRRLERHLDQDLIDRMASGWTPSQRKKPIKGNRTPRSHETYRGSRRGYYSKHDMSAFKYGGIIGYRRLNRSMHWKPAMTYAEARVQCR